MATVTKTRTANQLVTGADVVVQSMINQGTDVIFAYPGGASMPLHQSLTKYKDQIRTILPRHEQGGAFAAQGYARTTGKPGLCMGTSGPGALNLVTAIADAKLDSIPLVALSGQVGTPVIGTDAFQETPIVEVCRGITKHHYLVTNASDIARVMKEAYHIATTGRPGPVLVDLPKNIQMATLVPDYDVPMNLPGYKIEARFAKPEQVAQVAAAIKQAKKPVIYAGGGVISSGGSAALRELVKKTGIPITTTVMGLGAVRGEGPLWLDMLGMHGSVYANFAVDEADFVLAIGVRFDDRVTGKKEEFAKHAFIVHVDIDASELNKNKEVHIPIVSDSKYFLEELNKIVEAPTGLEPWYDTIAEWKKTYPLTFDKTTDGITAQHAIHELWNLTKGEDTIISVGVGQHQMWGAQFYKFMEPRTWMSSSGLGTMGFGLPAAMGAKVAFPDKHVIDIDGDGCMLMNIQELATCVCEKIPVKVLLLNNQHLGMVVQWEDRFFKGNRAHTYLGPIDNPEAIGKGREATKPSERYPNFVQIAKGFGCGARFISKKSELIDGLKEMLAYDGPFVLDVQTPYQEHVLPMIPAGLTVKDIITK